MCSVSDADHANIWLYVRPIPSKRVFHRFKMAGSGTFCKQNKSPFFSFFSNTVVESIRYINSKARVIEGTEVLVAPTPTHLYKRLCPSVASVCLSVELK